eukprot:jgi/Mesen1/4839/ME000244S04018
MPSCLTGGSTGLPPLHACAPLISSPPHPTPPHVDSAALHCILSHISVVTYIAYYRTCYWIPLTLSRLFGSRRLPANARHSVDRHLSASGAPFRGREDPLMLCHRRLSGVSRDETGSLSWRQHTRPRAAGRWPGGSREPPPPLPPAGAGASPRRPRGGVNPSPTSKLKFDDEFNDAFIDDLEYEALRSGKLGMGRAPKQRPVGWNVEPPAAPDEPLGKQLVKGNNKFILASCFLLGIGAGIAVDTVVNVEPSNVASREVIDRQTPNPDICIASGMSAMVLDQRLFISFNPYGEPSPPLLSCPQCYFVLSSLASSSPSIQPRDFFTLSVLKAEVKPGCVLLQSNWQVLESRGLVSSEQVRDCKRNMNTFGFVGDLRNAPEVSCVYHSETAENQFLKDPAKATLGDGFQPRDFPE